MLAQADYNETYYTDGGAVGGYTNYREDSYASETGAQLAAAYVTRMQANGINIVGKRVLVFGCAYGFSIKYLVALGVNAFGMDWSPWAIAHAPAEAASRVVLGSAIVEADYQTVKALAGLPQPNAKFDLIIDEDMIECLTDAQVAVFETLAKKYSNYFVHYLETSPHLAQWYNYKTLAQWRTLAGGTDPKEKWYTRFSWATL